jgi:plastocyanin/uncharacterized membrane protein YozB (DUF420 family)
MQAIFGQRLSADINLVAQILIIIGLWVGFYFARHKQIPRHQAIQTTMVLANTFFILFVMGTSFYSYIIAGGTTTGIVASLMMVHGLLGLLAELTGIYLILRMSTKVIPAGLRVRNFKLVMRTLLGLWTVIVVLGFGIYYYRYLAPKTTAVSPLTSLAHSVDDIQIHSDEMAQSIDRGNLPTAKRHAEHLVNLIEGKSGADYGDVDGNGDVEDPGDGTGALVYLDRVRNDVSKNGGDTSQANALIDQMHTEMMRVISDAKSVVQASQVVTGIQPSEEASGLAGHLKDGPDALISQLAQALGQTVTQPGAGTVQGTAPAPGTLTVTMENYTFSPKTVQVKSGTTITFINHDPAKHTVTADSGKFDSGDINPGQTFTLKLDEPGTYLYYCRFHGDKGGVDMSGTIEVTP